jgi:DNA ligase-1
MFVDYNKIAQFYKKIEDTRSRLEIIDILSDMFRYCIDNSESLQEIQLVTYLTQGIVYPEHINFPKFRVSETVVMKALHQHTGVSIDTIKKGYMKRGDLGSEVEHILNLHKDKKTTVSTLLDMTPKKKKRNIYKQYHSNKIHFKLTEIARASGTGSNTAKMNILKEFFTSLKPLSVKYLINIILGNFRIGVADKTLLDGLTKCLMGSKDNRYIVEKAYMIRSDMGLIASQLLGNGIEYFKDVVPWLHTPIQMMLASRIRYTEILDKLGGEKCIAEYKYDGERLQVHKHGDKITLFSRNHHNITHQYPDVVDEIVENIKAERVIFEGEVVAIDPLDNSMKPFQVLSKRMRKHGVYQSMKEVPVALCCFDILYLDGKSLMDEPLYERRKKLEELFVPTQTLQLSIQKSVSSTEEIVDFYNIARKDGLEGIICKSITEDSIYQAGNRGYLWIKMKGMDGAKMLDTIDVVIIGGSWGKGRKRTFISTLYCAVFNKITFKYEFFTRVGTGFSDDDLEKFTKLLTNSQIDEPHKDVVCRDVPDIWVEPKIVIEIIGDELTLSQKSDAGMWYKGSGLGLRFPVFKRLREDKTSKQITDSNEIVILYKNQ